MIGPKRSYLQTLWSEAGEEYNQNWTKAEWSKKIEELQLFHHKPLTMHHHRFAAVAGVPAMPKLLAEACRLQNDPLRYPQLTGMLGD
jgi:DUF3072 family protein